MRAIADDEKRAPNIKSWIHSFGKVSLATSYPLAWHKAIPHVPLVRHGLSSEMMVTCKGLNKTLPEPIPKRECIRHFVANLLVMRPVSARRASFVSDKKYNGTRQGEPVYAMSYATTVATGYANLSRWNNLLSTGFRKRNHR